MTVDSHSHFKIYYNDIFNSFSVNHQHHLACAISCCRTNTIRNLFNHFICSNLWIDCTICKRQNLITMYAIRRDLRRGKTNGFFQVKVAKTIKKLGDVVEYIDGQKYDIVMTNCYLHNHIATSEKIHSGRYPKKRPCAGS